MLMLPAPTAVEEVEEASRDLDRPLLLLRLPLLLLLSAAHAKPLSVACASSSMLPAPTAVEEAIGDLLEGAAAAAAAALARRHAAAAIRW